MLLEENNYQKDEINYYKKYIKYKKKYLTCLHNINYQTNSSNILLGGCTICGMDGCICPQNMQSTQKSKLSDGNTSTTPLILSQKLPLAGKNHNRDVKPATTHPAKVPANVPANVPVLAGTKHKRDENPATTQSLRIKKNPAKVAEGSNAAIQMNPVKKPRREQTPLTVPHDFKYIESYVIDGENFKRLKRNQPEYLIYYKNIRRHLKNKEIFFIFKDQNTLKDNDVITLLTKVGNNVKYVHVVPDNEDYAKKILEARHNKTHSYNCKHMVDGCDDVAAVYLVKKLLDNGKDAILLTNDKLKEFILIECCPKFEMFIYSDIKLQTLPDRVEFDPSNDIKTNRTIDMKENEMKNDDITQIVNYRLFDTLNFKNDYTMWEKLQEVKLNYNNSIINQDEILPNKKYSATTSLNNTSKYKLLIKISNIYTIRDNLETKLNKLHEYLLKYIMGVASKSNLNDSLKKSAKYNFLSEIGYKQHNKTQILEENKKIYTEYYTKVSSIIKDEIKEIIINANKCLNEITQIISIIDNIMEIFHDNNTTNLHEEAIKFAIEEINRVLKPIQNQSIIDKQEPNKADFINNKLNAYMDQDPYYTIMDNQSITRMVKSPPFQHFTQ